MQDLNDKVNNGGATSAGQLDADEWNQIPSEIQNVIEGLDITLSGGDLNQLGKAIAGYVANGDFYIDSGIANAYDLAVVGSKQALTEYTDGATFRFIPTNTNTDSSTATVASLGIKTIKGVNGDNLVGGELVVGTQTSLVFDEGGDVLKLIPVLDNATFVDIKSGRKNGIINGDFDIWQRGISSSLSVYLADRWIVNADTSSNVQSQQSFTLGQTDVPNEPEFFRRDILTSGSTAPSFVQVRHGMVDVRTFAGQTVTLSFYARSPTSLDLSSEYEQIFGSGGGSADVTAIGVQKYSLTTTFQRFTKTVTIPSISGKTIGSGGDDTLVLNFWLDAGSDFNARTDSLGNQSGTIEISQVQVEPGTIATNFEDLSKDEVVQLCEPFFEKSYNLLVDPGTVAANGKISETANRPTTTTGKGFRFNTRKRGVPTIVLFSSATGASGMVDNNGDRVATVQTAGETGADSINITAGTISTLNYHFTADAEILS